MVTKANRRSLYQCFNARVFDGHIYCARGYKLVKYGQINIERLQRGSPLELTICQNCPDFDYMGEPTAREDRGW